MASSLVIPYSPYATPLVMLAAAAAIAAALGFDRLIARLARAFAPPKPDAPRADAPTPPAPSSTPAPVRAVGPLRGDYIYFLRCDPGPTDPYYGGRPLFALGWGGRHPRIESQRVARLRLFGDVTVAPGPWARCTQAPMVMQVVAGLLSDRHVEGPMFLASDAEFARAVRIALFMTPGASLVDASFPPATLATLEQALL